MKYEVLVEVTDWITVDADNEEDAKQAAIDIARKGAEWFACITKGIE